MKRTTTINPINDKGREANCFKTLNAALNNRFKRDVRGRVVISDVTLSIGCLIIPIRIKCPFINRDEGANDKSA